MRSDQAALPGGDREASSCGGYCGQLKSLHSEYSAHRLQPELAQTRLKFCYRPAQVASGQHLQACAQDRHVLDASQLGELVSHRVQVNAERIEFSVPIA